jgi:AmiR/NasT family two-component response regulator
LLDLLIRPKPRLRMVDRDAASALTISGASETPLRLVDVSSPITHSRTATRKLGRKSSAIGGRACVLHPEASTRSQFDSVLRSLGLAAIDFEDEAELAVSIRQERPEIVLWGMPGCTVDKLESIRAVARGGTLPIVVVAALGDEVTLDEVQNAGACDLIFLPLPCHRLAPALSLALLRHEVLEILLDEHDEDENRRAARSLVWRACAVWSKRRGLSPAEALDFVIRRSRTRGQNLTRTAMEVVAEGLFP